MDLLDQTQTYLVYSEIFGVKSDLKKIKKEIGEYKNSGGLLPILSQLASASMKKSIYDIFKKDLQWYLYQLVDKYNI
ncbi:hypothetical protein [Risungbinella massiliensis]|uniref:hypothetical protein n=1 Tax=Risungbinella massiliensis TaxID=1329796 RepID=UPI0005CC6906|nr:hypothetical protein [Risungbinella massiliensis]